MSRPKPPDEAVPATETVRRRIAAYIEGEPRGLRDISQEIRVSEKEALGHLEHIARAGRHGRTRLVVTPARCSSCGYEFKKRQRLGKPGRCPICKGEDISPPMYQLVGPGV